ncbi:MAG: hypothetical protein KZQ83_12040 [gamma proteobacterium symbiont of Taylorina sp.]|nr:hypothetical protein [gamma proteobacterium symbiont of Taylorina sp.]
MNIIFIVFLLIVIVIFLSSPGWSGDFWFDDFPNIVNNSAVKIQNLDLLSLYGASAPITSGSGMTRPVSYSTFAVNYYWSGMDPYYFKLTNTIIHVINAILFFFLSIKLIQFIKQSAGIQEKYIIWLAFIISLFWAITPMNVTSSLYVVQRMNELSSMFIAVGSLLYLHIRTTTNQTVFIQILYLFLFVFVLLLAALSKENGVLLVPLCLCLEFLIRNKDKNITSNQVFFYLFLIFLLVLPLIYIINNFFYHIINITNTPSNRDFSSLERLLTQFRIVTLYARQTFFPDIYHLTLLHDGYEKSTSLFKPVTTFFGLIFWLSLTFLAFYFRKAVPWFLFGLLWFFVAHSIESTILPLELMFEHRNYTPSYGLIFLVIISIYFLWMKLLNNYKHYFFVLLSLYLFFLGINTFFVTNIWGNSTFMYQIFVENHPHSARSHLSWAELNAKLARIDPENKNYFDEVIKSCSAATNLNQNLIAGITLNILLKNDLQMNFDKDTELLYQRLKSIQANPTFIVNTRYFIEKGLSGRIKISDELIENYFKIILNNPKTKGMFKGIIYREYADYLYQKNGMSETVLEYLKRSIETYPSDINMKIYYTKALISAKRYKKAAEILKILYQMDKLGRYSQKLNEIKLILDSYY